MYPAPWLRASDADREAIVAHLGAAAADGRLTLDEYADRTRLVYGSRTWGELARLVHDLPAPPMADARATKSVASTAPSDGGLPLAALICGVVSIPAVACTPVGGVTGIAAVVLGIVSLRTAGRGVANSRGMAVAGLICGLGGVALQVAMIVFMALVESNLE